MDTTGVEPSSLSRLEADALGALLAGSGPLLVALRRQLAFVRVTERSHSGVGVFTKLRVPDELAVEELRGRERAWISDVSAVDVPGLEMGLGFVLFVEYGRLALLEAVTFGDEAWPSVIDHYRFQYDRLSLSDIVTPDMRPRG